MSKRIFQASLILSILMAFLTGGQFVYFIALSLCMVYGVSYLSVWYSSKQLYLFFDINSRVLTAGEDVFVEYKISNMSFVPIAYGLMTFVVSKQLGDMAFKSESAYFGPYQMITIKRNVVCKNRGYFTIGKLVVELKDPFGLFSKRIVLDKAIALTVHPKIHHIDQFELPAREFFGRIPIPLLTHEDFTSIKTIRKYRRGDTTKKIHWKLSAKSEIPYVKEYELTADTRVHLFLDGYVHSESKTALDIEDGLVETALSLVYYLLRRNTAVTLVCNTIEHQALTGVSMEHFEPFMGILTGYSATGTQPFNDFLRLETSKLYFGSTIIAVTHHLTKALLYTLIGLSDKRFEVILILYGTEHEIEADTIQILKSRRIKLYQISDRNQISSVLEAEREYGA